jgi:3-hydroxyisobutyrate dehydrogenase/putative dehydrogenase
MQVGWIGLGAMGAPMAARLARCGHSVHGYDIAADRTAALAADGVQGVATIAAAVGSADVVVIMVATPDQVEQVLFAPGGAAGALPGGAVVMIMVSGPAGAIARARPLLDALARAAPVVGHLPGDGQRMKLVNQLLCGVHIAAAAEALAFAETLGLGAADCWQVLREGAAASFMFDDRGARMVAGQFREARSALDIFVKDMGLVGAAADRAGASVPLAEAARRLYERGHDQGMGRLDDSALIEVLRQGR